MTSNPEQKRKLAELLDRVPHRVIFFHNAWSTGNGDTNGFADRDRQVERDRRWNERGRD